MTKEEKIKEAWDNVDGLNKNNWANYWTYDKAKEHGMDKDGWIKVYGYEPGEGMVYDFMRPPQLEGIENNNGWFIITDDLEFTTETFWLYNSSNKDLFRGRLFDDDKLPIHRYATHYQPIERPKHPIY